MGWRRGRSGLRTPGSRRNTPRRRRAAVDLATSRTTMSMKIQYGWVVVAIGALMGCVAVGAMMSLAVFLQPITQATGWSRAGVSSAATLSFLFMGAGGFGWGALNDRYGARPVVLAGSLLLGLGLVLASRAATPAQFIFAYGVLVGLSGGSFIVPMMTVVSAWLPNNRSIAVSLVSAGDGRGPRSPWPLPAPPLPHTPRRGAPRPPAAAPR